MLGLTPNVKLLVALAVIVELPVTVVLGVPEPVWVAEFVVVGVGVCEGELLPVRVEEPVSVEDGVPLPVCVALLVVVPVEV